MSVDVSEYAMCISFIREKGKGLFFDNFWELFEQRNSPDEPSVAERSSWRQSNSLFVNILRFLYHRYKFIKGTILIRVKADATAKTLFCSRRGQESVDRDQ